LVYHLTNFSKQSTFGTRWVDICSSNSYWRKFLLDLIEFVKKWERPKTWNEEFNWWKVDTSLLFPKSDLQCKNTKKNGKNCVRMTNRRRKKKTWFDWGCLKIEILKHNLHSFPLHLFLLVCFFLVEKKRSKRISNKK